MTSYFQRLLVSYADRRGAPAARAFGARLVAQDPLAAIDVEVLGR
jgi:hypothetical protein